MGAFLGWIDGDPQYEEAVIKELGVWRSQDARDELGLGGIRDVFSDLFFPGLSTIQTRLRYFLFVQWCCELASRESTDQAVLATLRKNEVQLIGTLTALGSGQGVIGIGKQAELERMPSEIYWTGLRLLGMRVGGRSRGQWARQILVERSRIRRTPIAEGQVPIASTGFDRDRPEMPAGFPGTKGLDFKLTKQEATYLARRLSHASVDSAAPMLRHNLIARFQLHRRRLGSIELWEHPLVGTLEGDTRDLVILAGAFSRVMLGAVLLYQQRIAELLAVEGQSVHRDAHAVAFSRWCQTLDSQDVHLVETQIHRIQLFADATRHRLSPATFEFVKQWAKRCRQGPDLVRDVSALKLVEAREVSLKSSLGTSRILSSKARARWNGGIAAPMDYRWAVARSYLNDLAAAQ